MSDTNTRPATADELRREVQRAKTMLEAAQLELVRRARYLERMSIALDHAIEREAGK